ncbi:MAG: thiamine-binding protein [Gammaproteobacteria bacterium]|jgi:uncharacterized protein YqgV (UPF0045/DUF77 family)|nr:thiamine-binding protein [Gammaproteobacteria bacterium]
MAEALLSLQVIPRTPNNEDVIPYVDRAIAMIADSDVTYRVGPLETTMEGDLAQLLDIVRRISDEMVALGCPSVISQVKIYHKPNGASMGRLTEKYDG